MGSAEANNKRETDKIKSRVREICIIPNRKATVH